MTSGDMSLELWIERATRGLSEDAAARVRAEIAGHYRDALEQAGATPESALRSLGDAAAANRQYREVMLTKFEARLLRQMVGENRFVCARPMLRVLPFALAAAMSAVAFTLGKDRIGWATLLAAAGFAVLVALPALPVFTVSRGRVMRVLRWAWLVGMLALGFSNGKMFWSIAPGLLGYTMWTEMVLASIRRKLPESEWPKALYL